MAAASGSRPGAPITSINVTPLVDITLVLLIVFMVTARLVVSRGLPVDLPRAATSADVQQVFAISLLADGSTAVDGAPVQGEAELVRRARQALAAAPELRAVIQADGSVAHARVMAALDLLRQAGVARIAFAVAPAAPAVPAVPAVPAAPVRP
ncbi:MAG: biopolymer transporter ExbD [Anaeromyxobacter sp.]